MKIAVCAKVAPDTAAQIKPAADGSGIDTAGLKWTISPYDQFALEAAVQHAEKHGGSVHLFTVGDESVVATLKAGGLSVGADDLTHIDDPSIVGSDALGVARALAAAIQAAGCEAVWCGKQAVDDDNVQVPAMIAEILGWPLVSFVTEYASEGATFTATREVGGGVAEVVKGSFPAVFTADKGLNTPRYAKLPDIMKAKKKPVHARKLGDLGLSAGDVAARVTTSAYGGPPPRPKGRILAGDLSAQVQELVTLLRDEAKVL